MAFRGRGDQVKKLPLFKARPVDLNFVGIHGGWGGL